MDNIIINIDNIYRSDCSLFSKIYISCGAIDFPDSEWIDFSDRILINWTEKIITYQFEKNADFKLYFIESNSNRLDIHKRDDKIEIRCIEYDDCRERCLHRLELYYVDFLKALSKAISKFAYLLYDQNFFDGKNELTYKELIRYRSVIDKSIKEI